MTGLLQRGRASSLSIRRRSADAGATNDAGRCSASASSERSRRAGATAGSRQPIGVYSCARVCQRRRSANCEHRCSRGISDGSHDSRRKRRAGRNDPAAGGYVDVVAEHERSSVQGLAARTPHAGSGLGLRGGERHPLARAGRRSRTVDGTAYQRRLGCRLAWRWSARADPAVEGAVSEVSMSCSQGRQRRDGLDLVARASRMATTTAWSAGLRTKPPSSRERRAARRRPRPVGRRPAAR